MSVYKPCDIRGPVAELSAESYRVWGAALGAKLAPGARFVIGGDVRTHTPGFLAALAEGLVSQGLTVLNLGVLPTPMVYFGKDALNAEACAIVTASHNPPDINGLKWMFGVQPPTEGQVQELRAAAEGAAPVPRNGGACEDAEVAGSYEAWLRDAVADSPKPEGGLILVDPGNGCWCGHAARLLSRVFPDAAFEALHDEADGTFPNRNADCSKPAYLTKLADAVRARGASMGIAFDGDGDRVAFVDDEGEGLTAEEATYILQHSLGASMTGSSFVYDIKFSDLVANSAAELGATPLPERSGHAFIRARMLETGARFGAEISGHYFYGAIDARDDGLYSACRMLCHVARTGKRLSTLRKDCPQVFMTPDLRVTVPAEQRRQAIDGIKARFADRPQSTVDGVRIEFGTGWALVRASVTEPALTFRFEAGSAIELAALATMFADALAELGIDLKV